MIILTKKAQQPGAERHVIETGTIKYVGTSKEDVEWLQWEWETFRWFRGILKLIRGYKTYD